MQKSSLGHGKYVPAADVKSVPEWSCWVNLISKSVHTTASGDTVPPRSFHTNINYFRGTVKKK
jgi:hypothetical protein